MDNSCTCHDEYICDVTGEKRQQLMNNLKGLISKLEETLPPKPPTRPRPIPIGEPEGRPLRQYIGYIEQKHALPPPAHSGEMPLITNIQVHETRPTSDIDRFRGANTRLVTYKDACPPTYSTVPPPWELHRSKSQELRGGVMFVGCDCTRKNGLQDDCPRSECRGSPRCVARDPGPCCPPSMTPKPIRGQRQRPRNFNNCH